MKLLIIIGICAAWLAVVVQLGWRGKLQWLHAPDWVYAVIVFGPMGIIVVLLVIVRGLFRMAG